VAELQAKTSLKQTAMTANASADPEEPMELGDDGNQQPKATLTDLVNTVNEALQKVMESNQTGLDSVAGLISQVKQEREEGAKRPRTFTRGPDGKVTHVDGRPVTRDPATGRVTGVE